MSRNKPLKELLNELEFTTRVEIRRAQDIVHGALEKKGRRIEKAQLAKILKLGQKLLELDGRNLSNIPSSTAVGLGYILFLSTEKGQLEFVSLASPDYRQDLHGRHINIGNGKGKKEYQLIPAIRERVKRLDFPYSYEVLLADIDSEVKGKSPEEIEQCFAQNLEGLVSVSGIAAKRLSSYIDPAHFRLMKERARKSAKVQKEIKELQRRESVLKAHKITPEALKERAQVYAALGKLFEETAPGVIILDIQGKIYPYEQPFYDALREVPLPLLRIGRS